MNIGEKASQLYGNYVIPFGMGLLDPIAKKTDDRLWNERENRLIKQQLQKYDPDITSQIAEYETAALEGRLFAAHDLAPQFLRQYHHRPHATGAMISGSLVVIPFALGIDPLGGTYDPKLIIATIATLVITNFLSRKYENYRK